MTGKPLVLRSWTWNTVSAGFFAVLAAICFAPAIADSTPIEGKIILGQLSLVAVIGAGRAMTLGVRATPDALVIREILFTKRLPWSAVRGARLVLRSTNVPQGPPLPMPQINYVDAQAKQRKVTISALGAWSQAEARYNVKALNDLIRTYRPSRSANGGAAEPTGGSWSSVFGKALFTTEDPDSPQDR
jgi:hypothetical protein